MNYILTNLSPNLSPFPIFQSFSFFTNLVASWSAPTSHLSPGSGEFKIPSSFTFDSSDQRETNIRNSMSSKQLTAIGISQRKEGDLAARVLYVVLCHTSASHMLRQVPNLPGGSRGEGICHKGHRHWPWRGQEEQR